MSLAGILPQILASRVLQGTTTYPNKTQEASLHKMEQEADSVLDRFKMLMRRAQVGRLRSKASGPRADADTIRAWSRCADLAMENAAGTTHMRFTGIVKACSIVGFFREDLLTTLFNAISEKGVHQFSHVQVGEIVMSLGLIAKQSINSLSGNSKVTTLCIPMARRIVEECRIERKLWHESFSLGSLAEIMYGLGWLHRQSGYKTMNAPDIVHSEVVARTFQEKLKSGVTCSGTHYSLFLHGCANMGYKTMPVLEGIKTMFADWVKDKDNRLSLSEPDLLKIVWSFSGNKLGEDRVLVLLAPTILDRAGEMSSANLAGMLHEVCSCSLPDARLVSVLTNAAISARHLKTFKQQHLSKIVQGLGRAKHGNRDAFELLGKEIAQRHRILRFSANEILMILQGIEGAGVFEENLVLCLLERLLEKNPNLSPEQFSVLVKLLAGIKSRVELMYEDTLFSRKLVQYSSGLLPKVQEGIEAATQKQTVDILWSFGRLRYFEFKAMSNFINHFHSCVAYQSEPTNWESVGKVLSTYSNSNMQNCVQPSYRMYRLFQWSHQWVILNLGSATSPTDLMRVLWALVRFSPATPIVVIDKISSRIQELLGDGQPVLLDDWKFMVHSYLCVEYLHKLDTSCLSDTCSNLFNLAKEYWRSGMKGMPKVHKGLLEDLKNYGIAHQRGVLVVEDLLVIDVLIQLNDGGLALFCDGTTSYHENRVDDEEYLSTYKHRMLMGFEYLRNEVLEAHGYTIALIPYYTSSRWKRGSLKRHLIEHGLISEPMEVDDHGSDHHED